MAFPSSTGSLPITLESGWEQARQIAATVKTQAQTLLAGSQGAGVPGNTILSYCAYLDFANTTLTQIAAVPGMAAYAQAQIGTSLDVSSAFNTMLSAIVNTVNWLRTNFPKDGSGNLLYTQFASSGGQQVYTTFTSAQLSAFVPVLQALLATID